MPESTLNSMRIDEGEQIIVHFYQRVIRLLSEADCPFLVGGAHAFNYYTGIARNSKDFDIFIRRQDYHLIQSALRHAGYVVELTFSHWLAKIRCGEEFVDVIFNSGNGVAIVDDTWFAHAPRAVVLDIAVRMCPPEEMLWSKAFVMERERYDGADVAHLLWARAEQLDWPRLVLRFGNHWRVLLSHLILFGFVYPDHRHLVPAKVIDAMLEKLRRELKTPDIDAHLCGGPLLSREQYQVDTRQWGYNDGRQIPFGNMTPQEIQHWTNAIQHKQ